MAQDVFQQDYSLKQANGSLGSIFRSVAVDNNRAALGRVLFYDPRLSISGAVSCATCHKQNLGFADDVAFSTGIKGRGTVLNALALSNMENKGVLFWENRASSLFDLSLMPVANHIEMGFTDVNDVVKRIQGIELYESLFKRTYGISGAISKSTISQAIAEFLKTMRSNQSKYDMGYNGQTSTPFGNFTATENQGKDLFFNKYGCANCHGNVSRITNGWSETMSNIGLPPTGAGIDTLLDRSLKVPTLRNIALTAPYMHDGRFQTLDEVIEHYSHGITMNSALSWQLREGVEGKTFNISAEERSALIAFMQTLTDEVFIHDRKFSNPFMP